MRLGCGLRPIRYLLYFGTMINKVYCGCGLRPIRYLLYSISIQSLSRVGCGLRPIRYLLYYKVMAKDRNPAAVCGQFDICYTLIDCALTLHCAAVCGQFDICYTNVSALSTRPEAAVCGQFDICYTSILTLTEALRLRFAANSISAILQIDAAHNC